MGEQSASGLRRSFRYCRIAPPVRHLDPDLDRSISTALLLMHPPHRLSGTQIQIDPNPDPHLIHQRSPAPQARHLTLQPPQRILSCKRTLERPCHLHTWGDGQDNEVDLYLSEDL